VATSIWERLNPFTNETGFGGNNSMNSFNPYAFGAIAAWMYNYSLGIQRGEQGGFKHFILKPTPDPDGKMTFAKGHYDSMYGRIVSQWNIEAKGIRYQITIPPNTSARLYLKAEKVKKIRESGQKIRKVKGVEGVTEEDGWILFELVAGSYDFFVKK
jgi:alpha-L-rhamnosidase